MIYGGWGKGGCQTKDQVGDVFRFVRVCVVFTGLLNIFRLKICAHLLFILWTHDT